MVTVASEMRAVFKVSSSEDSRFSSGRSLTCQTLRCAAPKPPPLTWDLLHCLPGLRLDSSPLHSLLVILHCASCWLSLLLHCPHSYQPRSLQAYSACTCLLILQKWELLSLLSPAAPHYIADTLREFNIANTLFSERWRLSCNSVWVWYIWPSGICRCCEFLFFCCVGLARKNAFICYLAQAT